MIVGSCKDLDEAKKKLNKDKESGTCHRSFLMSYLRKYAAVIIPGAAGFRSMAKMKKLFYNFG